MTIETNIKTDDDLQQALVLVGNVIRDAVNLPNQLRLDLIGAQSMISAAKSRVISDIQAERKQLKKDSTIHYPKE